MGGTFSFPKDWKPPLDLAGPLPRETKITGTGIFFMVLEVALLVGAVPVCLYIHRQDAQRTATWMALRTEGREAPGLIVRLWQDRREKPSVPMVTYAFTAGGVPFTGECSVPEGLWNGLRTAYSLPVLYLPANPKINHPLAWAEPGRQAPRVFLGVLWLGWVLLIGRSLRLDAKLAAEGLPAAGVITKIYFTRTRGYTAYYQFRTKDGASAKGSCWVAGRGELGASVCILYLPQKPSRNAAHPMLLYRVKQ